MKVLTADQMAYIDRTTIEMGMPGIDLMRNAGSEVFNFIEKTLDIRSGIVVFAGKGNNGGDGFPHLLDFCYGVQIPARCVHLST